MKTKTQLLSWLRANLGPRALGVLSSHDVDALLAATALCPLISWRGANLDLFTAYGAIVREMQPHARHLAFHAIAGELDWGHRAMIWDCAGLGDLPTTKCQHEPYSILNPQPSTSL
jgi:hypothetical protein